MTDWKRVKDNLVALCAILAWYGDEDEDLGVVPDEFAQLDPVDQEEILDMLHGAVCAVRQARLEDARDRREGP